MFIDSYTWTKTPIVSTELLTSGVLRVSLEKPTSYRFHTGQYTIVRAENIVRQYSFSSSHDDETLELLIQREKNGVMSGWFHDKARVGGEIEISQAFGNFIPPRSPQPIVCIAGRIGIAPFVSMIKSGVRMQLLYSVRKLEEVLYPNLLKQIDTKVWVTSTSARLGAADLKPYVKPDQIFFLCGSKQFVDAMMEYLLGLGVEQKDIRRELFTLE